MKEDYLWDKTGADPAIEKLENALRAFSYDESSLPALPVVAVPEKRPFLLRFAPAVFAMAGLVAAAVAWGIWIQFSGAGGRAPRTDIVEARPDDAQPPAAVPHKPVPPYIGDIDGPAGTEPRRFTKISTRSAPKNRARRMAPRPVQTERPKFTKEEIYAYDQLVLALSITSDKLGQVREKAIGER
jgi:hypothetical protein